MDPWLSHLDALDLDTPTQSAGVDLPTMNDSGIVCEQSDPDTSAMMEEQEDLVEESFRIALGLGPSPTLLEWSEDEYEQFSRLTTCK